MALIRSSELKFYNQLKIIRPPNSLFTYRTYSLALTYIFEVYLIVSERVIEFPQNFLVSNLTSSEKLKVFLKIIVSQSVEYHF